MTSAYNPLPLLSVKSELDRSLTSIGSALDKAFSTGNEAQALTAAIDELHRMVGVLRMLGLRGLGVFCTELELHVRELGTGTGAIPVMRQEAIQRALFGLTHYLNALADGASNATLRLFQEYQDLLQARGIEMAFEVDLFFPDLQVDLPSSVLDDPQPADPLAAIKSARVLYQQNLLKWLRQDNPKEALGNMMSAVRTVLQSTPPDQSRAFWWIAGGLLNCVFHDGVPPELDLKKPISRIDQRMRALLDSSKYDEVPALSEMLYLVARSHTVSETVETIKLTYQLDAYLPEESPLPHGKTTELLATMLDQLSAADTTWERCVLDDTDACKKFAEQVEQLYLLSEQLERDTLQFLCKQVHTFALRADDPERAQRIANDMAMALLLLRSGIGHYQNLSAGFHEQARILSMLMQERLMRMPEDQKKFATLVSLYCEMEQQEVMAPLAAEMQSNLHLIEQSINAFFGNTSKRPELAQTNRMLNQVQGGLAILKLDAAGRIVARLRQMSDGYLQGETPSSAEMAAFAAALSLLDSYVLGLTLGQKPATTGMDAALQELNDAASNKQSSGNAERKPDIAQAGVSIRSGDEDAELLEVFLEEAQEVLETLRINLEVSRIHLESREPWLTIRRAFHTLKGSGRMVGLAELGEVAWALERAMNKWLADNRPVSPALLEMVGDAEVLFQYWVDMLKSGSTTTQVVTSPLLSLAERVELGIESQTPPADTKQEDASIQNDTAQTADEQPAYSLDFEMAAASLPAVLEDEQASVPEDTASLTTMPLIADSEPTAVPAPAEEEAMVQIGAVSIAPALFRIASEEASKLVETLQTLAADLQSSSAPEVTYDFMRAAHTIAGINRTMGFAPVAELASALELWLEARINKLDAVKRSDFRLLNEAIAGLDEMTKAVQQRNEPRAKSALIARLHAEKELLAETELTPPDLTPIFELELPVTLQHDAVVPEAETPAEIPAVEIPAIASVAQPNQEVGEIFLPDLSPVSELELPVTMQHDAVVPEAEMPAEIPAVEIPAIASVAQPNQEVGEIFLPDLSPVFELELPVTMQHDAVVPEAETPAEIPAVEAPAITAAPQSARDVDEPNLPDLSLAGDVLPPITVQHAIVSPEPTLPADEIPVVAAPVPAAKPRSVQDELDEQLLPIFLEEAHELYPQIGSGLRAWRDDPGNAQASQNLLRNLHTLKGSARMAGAMRLGELTHLVEDRIGHALSTNTLDGGLWAELDTYLDRIAHTIEQLQNPQSTATAAESAPAIAAPLSATAAVPTPAALEIVAERAMQAAMLRVRSDVVDRLVNEAGEISVARSRVETELREFKASVMELTESVHRLRSQVREIEIHAEGQMQARTAVSGDSAEKFDPLEFDRFTRFQELTRFMSESVHDVQTVQHSLLKNLDETVAALNAQSQLNRDLQQGLMSIRMVPFSSIRERLYRVVRQTGKELGKRVNLELLGTDIELDRSVLEKMTAPFEHLLRNAIAHGLETPELREQNGKDPIGEIRLSLQQESNEVVFVCSDDGAGLDLNAIRRKALGDGTIHADEEVSDEQLMQLIFKAGLSTAQEVSEISGRGVGLDVVSSEISALGGRVDVSSEAGRGVRFTIHLPLTLAVAKTLMVRAGHIAYALPAGIVTRVEQLKPAQLEALYKQQYLDWQGVRYPMYYLPRLLGNEHAEVVTQPHNPVLLLKSGDHQIALHVDELLGNQEAVVKNIGPQLARVPGIAGATVSGSGTVILIINPVAFTQRIAVARQIEKTIVTEAVRSVPVVMVVDDSLTVRKITTRLLERAGYQVVTAKDGVDALEQLVELSPTVMLLDVEMPRMDGFELAKRLRQDSKTRNLPVIMITSRTADKHRNYALELGVNEYLGKPYQEDELLHHIAHYVSLARSN